MDCKRGMNSYGWGQKQVRVFVNMVANMLISKKKCGYFLD
jgi:hypothetical protein